MGTLTHQPAAAEIDAQAEEVVDDLAEEEVDANPQPAKPRAKRSPPKSPNVVTMDMHAPISLAIFAQGKDSKSQHKRYMISAAWLKVPGRIRFTPSILPPYMRRSKSIETLLPFFA